MIRPPFPSAIGARLHHSKFLTTKTVRKNKENDGQTGGGMKGAGGKEGGQCEG